MNERMNDEFTGEPDRFISLITERLLCPNGNLHDTFVSSLGAHSGTSIHAALSCISWL